MGQTPAVQGRLPRSNSVQPGFPLGFHGGSQAIIKFNEDGGASVISGVLDNGQGNDNMLVQIAAEELGIRPEDVQLATADTEITLPTPAPTPRISYLHRQPRGQNSGRERQEEAF